MYFEEIMLIVLILLLIVFFVIVWIREDKKDYERFNYFYPIGSLVFRHQKKKPFSLGKWDYRGTDQRGIHVYVRVK